MQTHSLIAHPASGPAVVRAITARWGPVRGGRMMLRFRLDGGDRVVLPPPAPPARADGLWQTTCFELFLAGTGGAYREYNFSPSGQWAAYAFSGYRTGRCDHPPAAVPEISTERGRSVLTVTVFLPMRELAGGSAAALSAVIEETGGTISHWASRHGSEKPDFHNPACFVLPIPTSPAA